MFTFVKVWGIPTGIQMIHQSCISPIYLPRQLTSQTLCKYWRWSSFILISEFMKMAISVWFTSYLQLWEKGEKLQWKEKYNTHMTLPGLAFMISPSFRTHRSESFLIKKAQREMKTKARLLPAIFLHLYSFPFPPQLILSVWFWAEVLRKVMWGSTTDNSVKTLTLKDINQKEYPSGTGGKN